MLEQADVVKTLEAFYAAYNTHDWAAVAACCTADFESEEMATRERTTGVDAHIEGMKRLATAFPDVRSTIRNVLICGDQAVVEHTMEGTHTGPFTGPFGTIPPTGKRLSTP